MVSDSNTSNSGLSAIGARHRSAAAAAAATAAVDRATLVTFTVGRDTLAAPVESVERVLRYVAPSPIPGMPDWLEGVISYRNVMLPVIDLRKRFGRSGATSGVGTRIVVFNTQPEWLAAIVDAVTEVVTVDASTIAPPPPLVRGLSGAYLLGMVKHREQVVLVLDAAKVLSAGEVLVLESLVDVGEAPSTESVDD
ncbi:MAG: chemotaxis protein CheW [Gemmatimonadaceae bacterium]